MPKMVAIVRTVAILTLLEKQKERQIPEILTCHVLISEKHSLTYLTNGLVGQITEHLHYWGIGFQVRQICIIQPFLELTSFFI